MILGWGLIKKIVKTDYTSPTIDQEWILDFLRANLTTGALQSLVWEAG
jgi:hypothetical protein